MNDPLSERVARSLIRLGGTASFAAVHHEPALGLSLEVDGVGRCDLPLSPERIRALVDQAVPSPFGYREKTVRDPSIRDSWEITGTHVHLLIYEEGQFFARHRDSEKSSLTASLGISASSPRSRR
jgi:hypothetical protein